MLGPYELLDKVMEYAKYKFDIGELSIPKTELRSYIIKIDSGAETGNLDSVIHELDARGCILINTESDITLDPACFQ